ncbi:MAG: CehA/McbA family metallohydrolase [Lachnospiraceae bacterium]|nr:CehA/McbA family metallohydrolase [Lachnospiraceae bacterium]
MSVSKLSSTITGLYSGQRKLSDEKYTYRYLQTAMRTLDEAVGYSARGGRKENVFPSDWPDKSVRLNDYKRMEKVRKNPDYGTKTAKLSVKVRDENGDPLIAEIRLYPNDKASRDGVTSGYTNDYKIKHIEEIAEEIYGAPYDVDPTSDYVWYDYFRRTTAENGEFSEELPVGRYRLVCDKGSEFEVVETAVNVPGTTEVTLRRLVDMGKDSWYVGDLHHHSVFSSPLYPPQGTDYVYDTPEMIQNSMRAKGLTFGALSDHHNVLNHRTWEKLVTPDFLPILSKEISTSNGHVLQLNTDPDVIYHIPEEKDRTPEIMRAEYRRITDEIKGFGGHPQINHPRDMQKAISFPPEFTDMIDIFKTIEIWNGSHPLAEGCTNGNAMQLWLDCLEKGTFLGATTGSDTHEITCEFWFDSLAYVFGLYTAVKAALDNTLEAKNEKGVILEGENLELAHYFVDLLTEELPILKHWGEVNLSSGCVRTYVHAEGERTPENLLKNLEQGHSFLTNGPIIEAKLQDDGTAELKIVSNRPLSRLLVYSNGQSIEEFDLADPADLNGGFDYSCTVNLNTEGKKWFIFRLLGEDVVTEAITNPVFVK